MAVEDPPPAPLEELVAALEEALDVPPGGLTADVPEPLAVPPDWFGTTALLELEPNGVLLCWSAPPLPDVGPPCDEQAQGTTVAVKKKMRGKARNMRPPRAPPEPVNVEPTVAVAGK